MPDLIDYEFIAAREGKLELNGYVPAANRSKSGTTIATGFDLGQRSKSDLVALSLPSALITKLSPYLGKTGAAAEKLLKKTPLKVTLLEAISIDQAFKKKFAVNLAADYDSSTHNIGKVTFFALLSEAQTVIASVSFQYGDLSLRTPRFWKAACTQDWAAAVKELRNFGDDYPSRRELEAKLLSKIVVKKAAEVTP